MPRGQGWGCLPQKSYEEQEKGALFLLGVKIPRKAFTESGTLQNKCDLPSQRLKLAAQKTPARRKCMKGHGNKKNDGGLPYLSIG